jgi:hypothetical protein
MHWILPELCLPVYLCRVADHPDGLHAAPAGSALRPSEGVSLTNAVARQQIVADLRAIEALIKSGRSG